MLGVSSTSVSCTYKALLFVSFCIHKMPSHTIQSVLVKLHSAGGAPWQWETWKEITSIRNGIFPSDDTLLPKGLTRKDVTDIRSYFAQYDAQPSEDAKIKFASGKATQIPGRTKWRDWITSGWRLWNIHSKISDVLTTEELHPLMIMANNSEDSSSWPQGELYIPLVVDAVALNLFGDESLDPSGRLKAQYRPLVQHIVQRTWINISKQTKRNKGRLETLEAAATKAFEGKGSFICLSFFFELHRCLRHETFTRTHFL